jgi:hypothetical protein
VTDEGIVLAMEIKMRGRVMGQTKATLKWADLTQRQREELARGAKPEADAAGAGILSALAREDFDAVRSALDAAGDHPLAGYAALRMTEYESRAQSALNEKDEEAAEAAWQKIAPYTGRTDLTAAEARDALKKTDAFQRAHGASVFAASVSKDLSRIRSSVDEAIARSVDLATTKGAMVAYCGDDGKRDQVDPRGTSVTTAGMKILVSEPVVTRDAYDVLDPSGIPLSMKFTVAEGGKRTGDPVSLMLVAYYPELIDDDPDSNPIIKRFWWLTAEGRWRNGLSRERGGGFGDGRSITGGPVRVGDVVEFSPGTPAENKPLEGITLRVNGKETRMFSNTKHHARFVHLGVK